MRKMAKLFSAGRVLRRFMNAGPVLLAEDGIKAFNRGRSLSPGLLKAAVEDKKAELFIYGDIGGYWDGISAEEFAREIGGLDVTEISVRINSPGGIVFDGVAIYNALVRHSARVVVNIDGIAASIASVIAMAGDEINISEGSHVMIHRPWSYMAGDAEAMRKEAEVLDKLEAGIIDIYEARTGKDRGELEAWIAEETWFLGQEAVDAGFADTLIPAKKKEKKAARSELLNLFRHTPKELLPERESPGIREFEHLLRDGEGLSHSQAKRVAALAAKALPRGLRDVDPANLRDGGEEAITAADLGRLANFIKSMR